jgi:hypothetical protein
MNKTTFYIIVDFFAGEYLTKYNPEDSNEWEWYGDNCLDYHDISPIHPSARFPTKEEAYKVRDIVHNTFKSNGVTDLNFGVYLVEAETVIVEKTTVKAREVFVKPTFNAYKTGGRGTVR